jgi:hypothetical protein
MILSDLVFYLFVDLQAWNAGSTLAASNALYMIRPLRRRMHLLASLKPYPWEGLVYCIDILCSYFFK